MKKLKLVVSLPNENSYQLEQARAARETAAELGVDVQILFADNDAVTQSQQVLEIVQSPSARPDAILFEPLSATALSRVGEAAVAVGIGWFVLNCDVEYIAALRVDGTKVSMSAKGESTQNPYSESFWRTLKVEEVYLKEYETMADALKNIEPFIEVVYTKKRLHASLDYRTPEEFEEGWQQTAEFIVKIPNPKRA